MRKEKAILWGVRKRGMNYPYIPMDKTARDYFSIFPDVMQKKANKMGEEFELIKIMIESVDN